MLSYLTYHLAHNPDPWYLTLCPGLPLSSEVLSSPCLSVPSPQPSHPVPPPACSLWSGALTRPGSIMADASKERMEGCEPPRLRACAQPSTFTHALSMPVTPPLSPSGPPWQSAMKMSIERYGCLRSTWWVHLSSWLSTPMRIVVSVTVSNVSIFEQRRRGRRAFNQGS